MRTEFIRILRTTTLILCSYFAYAQCPFEENNGVVAFEAEDFTSQEKTSKREWYVIGNGSNTPTPDPDGSHAGNASGGKYLEILPDTRVIGHSGPGPEDPIVRGENFSDKAGEMAILNYKVYFNSPGKYYVWIRLYSSGPEDNSVHVGINDTWPTSGERSQWCTGKNNWTWESKQRTSANHCGEERQLFIDVPSAGEHTFQISMREDGVEIDKIVLSKAYTKPTGTGPAVVRKANCEEVPTCSLPTVINNSSIAVVADGNSPDPDDIGATAVTLAMMKALGVEKDLVYYSHSCDLKPFEGSSQTITVEQEAERQVLMQTSCDGTASRWGGFEHIEFYNCRTQKTLSINKLRDAINNATSVKPLAIIEAGEPDIIYDAIAAANSGKRQYVTIVTHHIANDESADDPNKNLSNIVVDFPSVNVARIPDQNEMLKSDLSVWHWARDHEDSRIKWLWTQGKIAEQDPAVGFQTGKFDCSDAGMIYFQLMGKQKPTAADFKSILNCYISGASTPDNIPPTASFSMPTVTEYEEGASLGVIVDAADADGIVESVELFVNDELVRVEKGSPYEWGSINPTKNDEALLNLAAGEYTLKAIVTDDKGASAQVLLAITVKEKNVAPTVTITSPNEGDEFELGEEIILSANSTDANGNLSHVNFKVNNAYYKQDKDRQFESTFTPTEPGTYIIGARAFDSEGLTMEVSVTITVKLVTNLSDAITENELNVLPNPSATGVFNLSQEVDYVVCNMTGEEIARGNSNHIDLSMLPSGVYIMKTQTGTFKLIK